jgi:type IV pilus assembly protein PilP
MMPKLRQLARRANEMSRQLNFALSVTVIALLGCGGGEQTELREWMQDQTKDMRGGVHPLPEMKSLPAVSYEGLAKIVPFSPQRVVTVDAATNAGPATRDADRERQPLESFPLEDLVIQGVIQTGKRPYALVQPKPPNKPLHVGVGDYMGQNFGKVISITSDAVTVLETVRENNGVWTEREIIKPVPRQGGKK